ncbi:MAG: hypothetical protein VX617_01740 [Pseudomonadota bacterium]|nr:hypothetical protein [Pseudomonadota bacterium]
MQEKDCLCLEAITKAYTSLKMKNLPDYIAFDSAVRIYQHYHPDEVASSVLENTKSIVMSIKNLD